MTNRDSETCPCDACRAGVLHTCGCAVHRAPAEPVGPCDCGALAMSDRITRGPSLGAKFIEGIDEPGLRWQAFEAARLLKARPSIEQQLADAQVLLPAMQRWAEYPKLYLRANDVLVRACAEASSAQEAIELAERLLSFLLLGEVPLSASASR